MANEYQTIRDEMEEAVDKAEEELVHLQQEIQMVQDKKERC